MHLSKLLSGLMVALVSMLVGLPAVGAHGLHGIVESGGTGLKGYEVSLYAIRPGPHGSVRVVGRDVTRSSGAFAIDYRLPPRGRQILFVGARRGEAMLVSAIGRVPYGPVVVNERTTIATGFAFAQFVKGRAIQGNRYGMRNAVHMAANMADTRTGGVAEVLGRPPNGSETAALKTFNSLANMVAHCVAMEGGCDELLDLTTLPGEPRPRNVLQAVANITKYPWLNVSALFDLSFETEIYAPALTRAEPPDAWTLFLKFTGSFSSEQNATNLVNGPGAFAIDRKGFLWVANNYTPVEPSKSACAGKRLLKFYPWGENFPGSPYFGGGLSGAGFGISIAPSGRIWVGNFGFAGVGCPIEPPSNSVSLMRPNGEPISPDFTGYTQGPISWPQGTVADRRSNLWIANCGSDSVTLFPRGRPHRGFEIPFSQDQLHKPFGVAIDHRGNAWVAGTLSDTVAVLDPTGDVIEVIESDGHLTRPMGVAADSRGNIWVANSDWMDPPCPPGAPDLGAGTNPSIALYHRDPGRRPHADSPFSGGGLSLLWGIAVDGNDTVWVANFGFPFDLGNPDDTPTWTTPNRVSHFCGVDTARCPPSKQGVGTAISPDGTGYTSDALVRNTGLSIDPSGNVWLPNNWKEIPEQRNPGGNAIVVLVGAAAPVKTPLIGTPRSFGHRGRRS